jgi:hypothetical protein
MVASYLSGAKLGSTAENTFFFETPQQSVWENNGPIICHVALFVR